MKYKNNNRRKTLCRVRCAVCVCMKVEKNRERRLNEFTFFRLLIAVVVASVYIQALPALVCNLTLLELFFYSSSRIHNLRYQWANKSFFFRVLWNKFLFYFLRNNKKKVYGNEARRVPKLTIYIECLFCVQ